MRCDIILTYNKSWISSLIRWAVGSKYTHVAIAINETIIAESWWNGVRFTKLDTKKNKFTRLRCPELTEHQKTNIIAFIYDKIDFEYDYKLLIGIGLNRIFGFKTKWDDPKKYICVELIIEAYRSVGIDLLEYNKDIAPHELLYSKHLKEL
jgi:uncharacterized protein YycO